MIVKFTHAPGFVGNAAVGAYEESVGPLGSRFDAIDPAGKFGQKTWEQAEEELSRLTLAFALKKAGVRPEEVSLLCAGDLQNQCAGSSGGLYAYGIPFLGLYGACSTCTEALLVASLFLSEGRGERIAATVTTSHNCTAERQFRTPIEYGGQRTPTAQWTATAGGAFLLSSTRGAVKITEGMAGRIIDSHVKDGANMGCAMAPAAADTLMRYFAESGKTPDDFDAVVTGDLGEVGAKMLCELTAEAGLSLAGKHLDCGNLLYDKETQDVHSGASGCGCSASVLSAYFLPMLACGEYRDVLFLSTGALMNAGTLGQGEPIFGIAPLVHLHGEG